MAAPPAYSYGTTATVYGKNPTDSYYVLDTQSGGGTTIAGDLTVTGPLLTLGPSASSQVLVEDLSGLKMKVSEGSGVGTIVQSNAAGVTQAPYIGMGFGQTSVISQDGSVGTILTWDASGNTTMNKPIRMNNNTIVLSSSDDSALYYDAGANNPVVSFPAGREFVIAEDTVGGVASISATGAQAAAFGTNVNNSAAPISVPTATPTTIFTIPLAGGGLKYQKMWRILVGYTDGATNYECSYVDVGVFWNGTTNAHYVVAGTSPLPVGWSLTVPTITSGAVEFTHTFGSALDVYVSSIVMGQNV